MSPPRKGGSKGGSGSQGGKGDGGSQGAKFGGRQMATRVKSAKGRKISSTRWLQRHLNDPYVAEAQRRGYRSRAAFKLIEMDDKYGILKKGARVVDLGATPGGWSQVAVERTGPEGKVIALDINEMESLPDVVFLQQDFLDPDAPALLMEALGGPADVVLSDMAAPTTGHPQTDHLRIMALLEAALDFADDVLVPGGSFVAKVFQGGSERELLTRMKRDFAVVRHAKPPSSRKESSEMYVVATGYRGGTRDDEEQN